MEKFDKTTLANNIALLSRGVECLKQVQLQGDNAGFCRSLGILRVLLEHHKNERVEREKLPFKQGGGKQFYYEWWFYPKVSHNPDITKAYKITNYSPYFKHWIDALDNAVTMALQCKILGHCRDGDYVLMLLDNENQPKKQSKFQMGLGRTRLVNDGRLPEMEYPKQFAECEDLLAAIYSMQLYTETDDEVDGPTGVPFIITRTL